MSTFVPGDVGEVFSCKCNALEIYRTASASSYTTLARTIFNPADCCINGTTLSPLFRYLAYITTNAGEFGGVRLYDVTNAQVLYEKTDITNLTEQIFEGALTNLPSVEAIVEFQVKVTKGSIYVQGDIVLRNLK